MVPERQGEAALIAEPTANARPFGEEDPSITIGGRRLSSRYFLAPLAGYTHLGFRTVLREIGGLGLATTDLVLATMLAAGKKKALDLVATSPADRPLTVQIFSGVTEHLVAAARRLVEMGFEAIDLNMGCPMAKVNGRGGGARMMCDTGGACGVVEAVLAAVEVPVTVKMRLGWDRENLTAPALAREFERLGVAAVTVHGRTRSQGFHGEVNLDGIRETVEAVDSMPVVGNGDVRSPADAIHMRRVTGCDAVAIGRGAMLDPWIFRRLERLVHGQPDDVNPSPDEQIDFLVRHYRLVHEQHGPHGCLMFRKFAGWYGARLGIPEDLEDRLRRCESLNEFDGIATEIRQRHGERESDVATALVRVPNGPVERW